MIKGYRQVVDPASGKKVYDVNGLPIRSATYEILGNGIADITGGLNNSLSWKRFKLDALIDFKFGGDIYSGTNVRLVQSGFHKMTVPSREAGVDIDGVYQTGTGTTVNQFTRLFQLTQKITLIIIPVHTGATWGTCTGKLHI